MPIYHTYERINVHVTYFSQQMALYFYIHQNRTCNYKEHVAAGIDENNQKIYDRRQQVNTSICVKDFHCVSSFIPHHNTVTLYK